MMMGTLGMLIAGMQYFHTTSNRQPAHTRSANEVYCVAAHRRLAVFAAG